MTAIEFDPTYFDRYSPKTLIRFREFLEKNMNIYEEFVKRATQMLRSGRKKYSARTIIEVMRWHTDLYSAGEVFKITGDFVPMMARLLASQQPEFKDFFDFKNLSSKAGLIEEGF